MADGAGIADEEALPGLLDVLQHDPLNLAAYVRAGACLLRLGFFSEAEALFQRALELGSERPVLGALEGLIALRRREGHVALALELCARAAHAHPEAPSPLFLKANILHFQGCYDESRALYEEVLRRQATHAEARLCLGMQKLLMGDWGGFEDYQSRFTARGLGAPPCWWDGRPVDRLLLRAEQGAGDTIQFVRYAAAAKQAARHVIVACRRDLMPLLATCAGVDEVVDETLPLPQADAQLPLLNAPLLFRSTLSEHVPYLRVAAARGPPRIGLCQEPARSSPTYEARRLPLALVTELRDRHSALDFVETGGGGFLETASLIQSCDLVITCDTAVAHLAGALGVPFWVLLPFVPDWRWQLHRTDSDWYPTARLFRQPALGAWEPVFAEVARLLRQHAATLESPP